MRQDRHGYTDKIWNHSKNVIFLDECNLNWNQARVYAYYERCKIFTVNVSSKN